MNNAVKTLQVHTKESDFESKNDSGKQSSKKKKKKKKKRIDSYLHHAKKFFFRKLNFLWQYFWVIIAPTDLTSGPAPGVVVGGRHAEGGDGRSGEVVGGRGCGGGGDGGEGGPVGAVGAREGGGGGGRGVPTHVCVGVLYILENLRGDNVIATDNILTIASDNILENLMG